MICPKCGTKLGNLKNCVVAVHKGRIYAQLVPYETYVIDENKKANLESRIFLCPVCGSKFKPKSG